MLILKILRMAESLLSYEPNNGYLHRLNPITKLAFMVGVVVTGVYLSGPTVPWYCMGAVYVAVVAVCMTGGVDIVKELKARWPYFTALVGIILIGNLVFSPSIDVKHPHIYIQAPPFIYITNLSLNYALDKSFFLMSSLTVIILVLKSTRLADLTYALQRIGVPYAVAQIISTALRCIPMVVDGLLIVYNAQRARGFELEAGGVRTRVRRWSELMRPLFVVLLKWIDMMAVVFQARGLDFAFGKRRTRLRVVPFGAIDCVALMVGLGSLAGLVVFAANGTIHA